MDTRENLSPSEQNFVPNEIPGLNTLLGRNSSRPHLQKKGSELRESTKPPFVTINASLRDGDLVCWEEKPPQEVQNLPQISLHVALSLVPVFGHLIPPLIESVQPAPDVLGNPVTNEELATATRRALAHNAAMLIHFLREGGKRDMLYQIDPAFLPNPEQMKELERLAEQRN